MTLSIAPIFDLDMITLFLHQAKRNTKGETESHRKADSFLTDKLTDLSCELEVPTSILPSSKPSYM